MNDFEKISKYYIKYTDTKVIYDFICDLFKNNKDTLNKKDDTKIILMILSMRLKMMYIKKWQQI